MGLDIRRRAGCNRSLKKVRKMKVIIVGIGKVGYTLAEHLSAEGNDVAVIDKSQETVDRAGDNLDVFCVRGSGLSTGALLEAGVREADLIIATTSVDEINMLCCLTAKRLGGASAPPRLRRAPTWSRGMPRSRPGPCFFLFKTPRCPPSGGAAPRRGCWRCR